MKKEEKFIKYCDDNPHFVKRNLHAYPLYYDIYNDQKKTCRIFFRIQWFVF
jgi:hypothetical protein